MLKLLTQTEVIYEAAPFVYFFLLAVVSLISSEFQFQSESTNDKIQWSTDCDFHGFDFHWAEIPKDKCGESCSASDQCTHFTWANGVCYVKHIPTDFHITPTALYNAICGFIAKELNWKVGSNNRINWKSGCDFVSSDIGSISSSRNDCLDHCANNSRCTHFSWAKNECYLKQNWVSISAISDVNVVCGYIVEYFESNDGNDATFKWNSDPDVFREQIFRTQEDVITLKSHWIVRIYYFYIGICSLMEHFIIFSQTEGDFGVC